MVQTIQAKDVTLNLLTERFNLQRVNDKTFFLEWQDNLPELNDLENLSLNQVKEEYLLFLQLALTCYFARPEGFIPN
ncbi:MAG: hypothetical protein KME60_15950 [Cyanomargarita calcarea GSE-NOS-MK-12-04C]|jgi:hypothetical protein|uniref:Restriction endonuclease subunit R n=1 Tax=Cyanomargarita calcarea GSE-NOS-MK-12-04C TaxID=2839659 RepID=A0A951QMT8_9CYAN|nr:hypothetical protein [Cyanomargarita calcarea GSE-NOS-MK-12-04C]